MPISLEPGAVFGRYRVHRRLAIGGMAEVWLAQAVEGGKPVVLKRILPQFAQDDELLQRFEQEAELTLSLVHGNIVPVFEVGRIDEEPYMIMEYLSGHDVRSILRELTRKRTKAPIGVATYIAIETLRGLAYVHSKLDAEGKPLRLIHRDVSPSNIVVSDEGVVKLLDFGIAKVFGKAGATKTGILVGKVGYMSPEQVKGRKLTLHSDLFSASVVLYEMLAGQRLFDGESEAEILEKVRGAPIVPLSMRNPDVPKTLDAIVGKGLEREPAERWESAEVFGAELTSFMAQAGWPGDATTAASFMRDLFDYEKAENVELDDMFHTGTATVLPAGVPQAGKPLVLGGSPGADAPAGPGSQTMISPRGQGWLIALLTVAIVVALGAMTGVLPTFKLGGTPSPTPVVAAEGSLVITSSPSGAAIWVDGTDTGKTTPNAVTSGEKSVEITLKLPDYFDRTETLSIAPGRAVEHDFTLKPDERDVRVETTPAGATVAVNGRDHCTAPCWFRKLLPSQTIHITAEAPGHYDADVHLRVADINAPVQLTLRARPIAPTGTSTPAVVGSGKINLRVRPWAYLSIDGGKRTDKPLVNHTLTAGPHKVEIHNPEMDKTLECTFTIQPGETLKVPVIDLTVEQPTCPRVGG